MSDAEKYLNGRHAAHEIEIGLNLAYWAACSGADVGSAEYHYSRVLESFKELSAELGYRVEKIEPLEPALQSAIGQEIVMGAVL